MHLIETGSTDPYFNIATEEFLFRNSPGDLFMLYINSPSILIGKHQNILEEINYRYVIDNNLPVIRRMSGGGTVYHDHGNLNFTYMVNSETGKQVNFRRFIDPIADFLKEYGIRSEVGDKNEVRSGGLKFSGNAEHVFRNRVLHHGTILFSSDLDKLRSALRKGDAKFISRSVQSNRTSVGNLSEQTEKIKSTTELMSKLLEYMRSFYTGSVEMTISEDQKETIRNLAAEKYRTWDWNYAYGPDYKMENTITISGKLMSVFLRIEKGIIAESKISDAKSIHPLSSLLPGLPHRFSDIKSLLAKEGFGISDKELYRLFG